MDISSFIHRFSELSPKEEFHITIVGRRTAEKILQSLEKDLYCSRKKQEIEPFILNSKWDYIFKDEYYRIGKEYTQETGTEARESLIQMIEMPRIERPYQYLVNTVNKDLPVQMPHITLMARSTNTEKITRGIGVYSRSEFLKMKPERIN